MHLHIDIAVPATQDGSERGIKLTEFLIPSYKFDIWWCNR